jgi:transposase-like protein
METNLVKLIEDFKSEDQCRDYLAALRWPEGVCCPRCQSKSISYIAERAQYDCNACRHQFSVTAGSAFHDTHLPLWKWFLAVYIICESKQGTSANQLKRTLGVSYKTAWYLCHRIRKAMHERLKLQGVIEADEAFVGGKRNGLPGRGYVGKTVVGGMVERGGRVQLAAIPNTDAKTLTKFIERRLGKNVQMVITDAHRGYKNVKHLAPHKAVSKAGGESNSEDNPNAIENVWSLLKRSLIGSYHQVSAKHLPAYLDEIAFKFNNRSNPNLFRDTMEKLLLGNHVTFEELAA